MLKSKRAKDLIPKTAEELDKDVELVSDVIGFYYRELRQKMESLEHYRISVPILGTFTLSKKKLERSIKKIEEILADNTPENFARLKKYKITEELRDKQKALLDKIKKDDDEFEQRKKDLAEQRKNS
jgi:hypothetical protein